MDRRSFILSSSALFSQFSLLTKVYANPIDTPVNYAKGDQISSDIYVYDEQYRKLSLQSLLQKQGNAPLTVLYIFGGGAMGDQRPAGGIWCRDSFEDLYIIRTLVDKYSKDQLGLIPIACPPVFHTHFLGAIKDVFTDYPEDSSEFNQARDAFISSTQQAVTDGMIPIQPYYDFRMKLMIRQKQNAPLPAAYGEQEAWLGSFRAIDETQTYGVPNLWLLNADGKIMTDPFRGNIYHPHGGSVTIQYTINDVIRAIEETEL